MIMKSSLGKMLRKMPQNGDAGSTPSDMIARLGNLLGGNQQTGGVIDNRMGPGFGRPMQPPMAYPGGSSNFDESTGVYTPDNQGLSGFLSRFGGLLNKGPGRSVGYRAFDEGVGGGAPMTGMPMQGVRVQRPEMNWDSMFPAVRAYDVSAEYRANAEAERQAKIAAAKQAYAANPDAFLASMQKPAAPSSPVPPSTPQMPAPQPYQEEIVVAPRPMGPLSMPQDPEFNINTATNTFFKSLGDRVASGQMTLDQARAAQAEMRALQLNPAMANRAAATEIAQRNLQVGPYAPRQVTPMAAPQGLTLSNVPQQGAAPQPAAAPQGMAMGGLMAKYYGGAC